MRVLVTGSFDPLHSGHIRFFKEASCYGDLFVGIGSDESIDEFKHETYFPQEERLYMVKAIRYVKDAWINSGMGANDFFEDMVRNGIHILVVNEDQHSEEKENFCYDMGIKYVVLQRKPEPGLPARHSSDLR